jgi:hypothetical protein
LKVTKGAAFLVSSILLSTLAMFMVLIVAPEARSGVVLAIAGSAFAGQVAIATAFIVGNVADNGVKGKYYQSALDK